MTGGWAPHLRGLMRAPDGSLWFTADYAGDIWTNWGTRYFRQNPTSGEWELMGDTRFLGGIRQNGASILKGDIIYTYAVQETARVVQESFFSTTDPAVRGTRYIHTGTLAHPLAGYGGAAVSPAGNRVVWWLEYPAMGPAVWVYLYNLGGNWLGPVVSPLPSNRFSYVYATFVSDTRLVLGGELFDLPLSYQAAIAELQLGQPLSIVASLFSASGENVRAVSDIWVDPVSGGVHVLAETNSPSHWEDYTRRLQPRNLIYFYKPAGASWSGHNVSVARFDHAYRGRFLDAANHLYFLRGSTYGGGFRILKISKATLTGAINWGQATEWTVADLPSGLSIVNGIWVEDSTYQTTAARGLDFVVNGNWPNQDGYLWHVKIT
jgi:hypothetical protein